MEGDVKILSDFVLKYSVIPEFGVVYYGNRGMMLKCKGCGQIAHVLEYYDGPTPAELIDHDSHCAVRIAMKYAAV